MILKDLHYTLLMVLNVNGELTKSKFHRHAGAKTGEIDKARKQLKKWKLIESRQPFILTKGMRPTYFKITEAGKKELAKFKAEDACKYCGSLDGFHFNCRRGD